MLLILRRHCDADAIEKGTQRAGLILATTYRQIGEGRQIPEAGKAGPEPSGMASLSESVSAKASIAVETEFEAFAIFST